MNLFNLHTSSEIEAIGSSGAAHAGGICANFIAEVPRLKRHPQPVSPHSAVSHRRSAAGNRRRICNKKYHCDDYSGGLE